MNAKLALLIVAVLFVPACKSPASGPASPEEARGIAKEAFLYGYPMAESYKIIYAFAIGKGGPQYKAPFNTLYCEARVITPADTTVVTPNSDTPYSYVVMDLRTEPIVLTVPAIDKERYYSIQLIDLYTHNFAYIGTRATGNGAGSYLVAGPGWKGAKPDGVAQVLRSETELVVAIYRTQLMGPDDLGNVEAIQRRCKAEPLSRFQGRPAPAAAPAVDWPQPTPAMIESVDYFRYLAFLLRFAPVHESERGLRARFGKIGIGTGHPFDPATLSPEMKAALEQGIADAWNDFEALQRRVEAGEVNSGDMFGTRAFLRNNYLYRFAGAKVGIWGNSKEEAFYPIYTVDSTGQPLDASKHRYTVTLREADLAAAKAFWSVTMYDAKTQLLIDNPLDRYLINSPMLEGLARNEDGSITLYVQRDSPGPDKEPNWLPAPDGPFYAVMRLYVPSPAVLDGSWSAPSIDRIPSGRRRLSASSAVGMGPNRARDSTRFRRHTPRGRKRFSAPYLAGSRKTARGAPDRVLSRCRAPSPDASGRGVARAGRKPPRLHFSEVLPAAARAPRAARGCGRRETRAPRGPVRLRPPTCLAYAKTAPSAGLDSTSSLCGPAPAA